MRKNIGIVMAVALSAIASVGLTGCLDLKGDGETVLKEGDIIFVKGETANSEEYLKNLESTVGELVESDTVQSEPEISSETLPDPPNPQEE